MSTTEPTDIAETRTYGVAYLLPGHAGGGMDRSYFLDPPFRGHRLVQVRPTRAPGGSGLIARPQNENGDIIGAPLRATVTGEVLNEETVAELVLRMGYAAFRSTTHIEEWAEDHPGLSPELIADIVRIRNLRADGEYAPLEDVDDAPTNTAPPVEDAAGDTCDPACEMVTFGYRVIYEVDARYLSGEHMGRTVAFREKRDPERVRAAVLGVVFSVSHGPQGISVHLLSETGGVRAEAFEVDPNESVWIVNPLTTYGPVESVTVARQD